MLSKYRRFPEALNAFVQKRPFLCILIVIAYVVVPFDFLPEIAFGPLGAFDDALVSIAALALLKRAAAARLAKRAEKSPPPPAIRQQNDQQKTDRPHERHGERRRFERNPHDRRRRHDRH